MDPLPGKLAKPATLHRYNYASANPVNRIDPSGREDLVGVGLQDEDEALATEEGEEKAGEAILCQFETDAASLFAAMDFNDNKSCCRSLPA